MFRGDPLKLSEEERQDKSDDIQLEYEKFGFLRCIFCGEHFCSNRTFNHHIVQNHIMRR